MISNRCSLTYTCTRRTQARPPFGKKTFSSAIRTDSWAPSSSYSNPPSLSIIGLRVHAADTVLTWHTLAFDDSPKLNTSTSSTHRHTLHTFFCGVVCGQSMRAATQLSHCPPTAVLQYVLVVMNARMIAGSCHFITGTVRNYL